MRVTVSSEGTTAQTPVVRIEASRGWKPLAIGDIWAYRELLYFLVWRDVKIRYKQTALGAAWAILQPFMTMVVFSVFFGRLARMPSDGIPYPLFAFAALVPWTFFANGLNQASNSLVGSAALVKKVYFPRLVIPLASVISGAVDVVLSLLVLGAMMAYYGFVPSGNVVFLPVFLLLGLMAALAVSLWLSALNVEFRDVRYTLPFLTQLWLFATPIAYPSSLLSEPWRTVYGLNPMVGVVDGFRWALLDGAAQPGSIVVASSLATIVLLIGGAFYFRRMERTFADVI